MASCKRCGKGFSFREKKYTIAGQQYCYPCMTCSSCHKPADGSQRIIYVDQVLCSTCNQTRLQPIKEKMAAEITNLSLPNPLGTRVLLDSGEVVRAHYIGIRIFRVGPTDYKSEGTFILTNRRVIYLQYRFTPTNVASNMDGSFEFALQSISGATHGSRAQNCFVIYVGKSEYEIFLYGTPNFHYPVDVTLLALLKLREGRIAEIKKASEREKVQVVMDFSWLRDYMDKGGVFLKTYKCPGCGAAVDIPKEGKSAKCNFCGASFYAEDVFKKVKDLIG